MSKRFNHVEPAEDGEKTKPGIVARILFRRKVEKGAGPTGILAKLGFRRKVEIPGRARDSEPLEIEREEPTQPSIPRTRAEAKAQVDPHRFDKTKSELERFSSDLNRASDRSLPKIKVSKDPNARPTADDYFRETMATAPKPTVASALGKIFGGLAIFLLATIPFWPRRVFRPSGGGASTFEAISVLVAICIAVVFGVSRRRRRY